MSLSFQLDEPLDGACTGQIIKSKKRVTVREYVRRSFAWMEYWL